jgi:2-C-methyl-D-erythritol 4-phosphate cytidylyltransferase/2-C-methyl-D-erythritol 2,4-cyclodiphosphate synthase
MINCFIILAGGESKRFNSKIPKPYHQYKGKPLLLHSIDKVKNYGKFSKIVLVINKKHKAYIKKLKIKGVKIITGGETRAESAYKGLRSVKKYNINNVMIHDAARPNFSLQLLDKLDKELKSNDCVVPAIQTVDSIKQKSFNKVINLKRENIYLIQTPQAFNYKNYINCKISRILILQMMQIYLWKLEKKLKLLKVKLIITKLQ